MNTLIKRAMTVAGITAAMALPLSGQASDGTITFTGGVSAQTCTINVNGSLAASTTVPLPIVSQGAFFAAPNTATPNTTAGGTFFNIVATGCPTAAVTDGGGTQANVEIYFEAGPNVDQATGGLITPIAVGHSNVEVKLYNASGSAIVGTQILPGTTTTNAPSVGLVAAAGTFTQQFYAGYSATGAATPTTVSAGIVSTSVTYSVIYL
jgi:major type 1 subunit fimbrin (pilin)